MEKEYNLFDHKLKLIAYIVSLIGVFNGDVLGILWIPLLFQNFYTFKLIKNGPNVDIFPEIKNDSGLKFFLKCVIYIFYLVNIGYGFELITYSVFDSNSFADIVTKICFFYSFLVLAPQTIWPTE